MEILQDVRVINIGLELFYQELSRQHCNVINVNWNPPPKISKKTEDFLNKLR